MSSQVVSVSSTTTGSRLGGLAAQAQAVQRTVTVEPKPVKTLIIHGWSDSSTSFEKLKRKFMVFSYNNFVFIDGLLQKLSSTKSWATRSPFCWSITSLVKTGLRFLVFVS